MQTPSSLNHQVLRISRGLCRFLGHGSWCLFAVLLMACSAGSGLRNGTRDDTRYVDIGNPKTQTPADKKDGKKLSLHFQMMSQPRVAKTAFYFTGVKLMGMNQDVKASLVLEAPRKAVAVAANAEKTSETSIEIDLPSGTDPSQIASVDLVLDLNREVEFYLKNSATIERAKPATRVVSAALPFGESTSAGGNVAAPQFTLQIADPGPIQGVGFPVDLIAELKSGAPNPNEKYENSTWVCNDGSQHSATQCQTADVQMAGAEQVCQGLADPISGKVGVQKFAVGSVCSN